MNLEGKTIQHVVDEIYKFRSQDVPWSRVLNSICTKPHPIVEKTFLMGLDTNLGDKRIFYGTAKLEHKCIEFIGSLLGEKRCCGNITSGGTEANFLAMYAARLRCPDIVTPEVIVSSCTHYSVNKAFRVMGFVPKLADVDENFRMRPDSVRDLISKNTIAIIATAGTSEFGSVDPVPELAEIAHKKKIYLHVDAATGAFIIPFAKKLGRHLPDCDFSLEPVSSITVDPHKYGLVPIPAGGILFRDSSIRNLIDLPSFFAGTQTHRTLIGTRPGYAVIATFAVLKHLGWDGYIKITEKNFQNTDYLVKKIKKQGVPLFMEPELNIVCIRIPSAKMVAMQLEKLGWIVSASSRIDGMLRVVINNHVDRNMLDEFLESLFLTIKQCE
jgi:tyrosine decarboxylase/tyrosine decarboxylase/aspartate 1-decarboxylase